MIIFMQDPFYTPQSLIQAYNARDSQILLSKEFYLYFHQILEQLL